MNNEIKRTFVKKGNKVILKQDMPNIELTSKDVITNLTGITNGLAQAEQQLQQGEEQIKQLKERIEDLNSKLKEVQKFEEWAVDIQMSIIKSLLPEVVKRAKEMVIENYIKAGKYDDTMTPEDNSKQMYAQLVQYAGRDKELAEKVAPTMISAHIYSKTMIENPWANMSEEDLKNNSI